MNINKRLIPIIAFIPMIITFILLPFFDIHRNLGAMSFISSTIWGLIIGLYDDKKIY